MSKLFLIFSVLLIELILIINPVLAEMSGDDLKTEHCSDCTMKYGDQTMINAVMLSTGPSLNMSEQGEWTRVFYRYPGADESQGEWTDPLNTSTIGYDLGISSDNPQGPSPPECGDYASICPGTYSYDINGIRIEHPGGGDSVYRIHCCGSFPWTPTYQSSEHE